MSNGASSIPPAAHSSYPSFGTLQDVELELEQVFDPNDPTVSATSEFFSSYSIPNQVSVATESPLPMGALVSPAVHLHPAPQRFTAAPQECATCGASVNLYSRLVPVPQTAGQQYEGAHAWVCTLCSATQLWASRINHFVSSGSATPALSTPSAASPAYQSPTTQAALVPVELAHKVLESVTPVSPSAAALGPTVFPSSVAANRAVTHGNPRSTGAGQNFFFVLDRNISRAECTEMVRSINHLVSNDLPADAGLFLITFGHTVALYDLRVKNSTLAAAQIFPGDTPPTIEDLETYISEAEDAAGRRLVNPMALPRVSAAKDQLSDALDAFEQSAAALEAQKLLQPRALGAAVEWALAIVSAGREGDRLLTQRLNNSAGKTAAPNSEPALDEELPPGSSFMHSTILILTSGPPDFGPGETTLESSTAENSRAAEFFAAVGARARKLNTEIHYACAGQGFFAAHIVRKMVEKAGGEVFLHKTFGRDFLADITTAMQRPIGYGGELEIFFSSGLKITRVIGAVAELKQLGPRDPNKDVVDSSAAPVFSHGSASSVNRMRLTLANCRPDQAISLFYTLAEDLPQDYVYLQFRFRWKDWNHQT
jgi:hypothetical protein